MKRIFYIFILMLQVILIRGQNINTDDILNVLISNGSITQEQADSLRADAAIKQHEADAKKKSFCISAVRSIQVSGFTQVRYQFNDQFAKSDGFDIRRARLDIKGNLSPYFSYGMLAEFAGSPKLLDAFGEIKLFDYLNVTLGQFKIPFSYENLASDSKSELIDRSQVVEALVARRNDVIGDHNGRDLGVQAGGSFIKNGDKYMIDYRLGLFNGNGINTNEPDTFNEAKDLAARLIFHPLKGLDIGGSYYNGFSYFTTSKTQPKANHERSRIGVELNYVFQNFLLRGEYIKGTDASVNREGFYILGGYYIIPKKLQVVVKYDQYDRDISKSSDITTNFVVGTSYNFNNFARLLASYTIRKEQTDQVNNNNFSIQFQAGF